MMESDISSREAEVRTLRQDVDTLRIQAVAREEEHKTEVRKLSAQLEETRRTEVSSLIIDIKFALERVDTDQHTILPLFDAGQTKRAAEDRLGGKCHTAEAAHQVRASVPQINDKKFTDDSDQRWVETQSLCGDLF